MTNSIIHLALPETLAQGLNKLHDWLQTCHPSTTPDFEEWLSTILRISPAPHKGEKIARFGSEKLVYVRVRIPSLCYQAIENAANSRSMNWDEIAAHIFGEHLSANPVPVMVSKGLGVIVAPNQPSKISLVPPKEPSPLSEKITGNPPDDIRQRVNKKARKNKNNFKL